MQKIDRLVKAASYASVLTAITLLCAKVFAWSISDSTSVLSSLLDSLMDIVASLVNFYAIRYALMPADDDHPFGHSKAEGIAALIQSAFILGSSVLLLLQVGERFVNPKAVSAVDESIGVMVFSILLTTVLVLFQRYVSKKTRSLAVEADATHYYGDILTGVAVIVALLIAGRGWYWVDPLIALMIAVVLIYSVFGIARSALTVLMDEALSHEDEEKIRTLARAHAQVQGIHDLLTRRSGRITFIQLHLELNGEQSLVDAHRITKQVENSIRAVFSDAQIIIHQDPV
jgi:ferrous-iron efflux pump FieF